MTDFVGQVETALGTRPKGLSWLAGGCVGTVYKVEMADSAPLVAKFDERPQPALDVEGYMLRYLAEKSRLPVPEVIHAEPRLLIMTYLPGKSRFSSQAEAHAAELLAELHGVTAAQFGLERDTLIGGLHQPNQQSDSWLEFFAEQRLLYMARQCVEHGRMPARLLNQIEKFSQDLGRWLREPAQPSLIHGDVWTTNLLAEHGRVTGFIDPAIYYADPEIELAFATLFGTFSDAFFARYGEMRPIAAGFFEERRNIYNLYPLLVHVRLFGGGYVQSVRRTLRRFGY